MAKATKRIAFQIAGIWLFLRILTSLAAAAFSLRKPISALEKQIPVWPPAQPFPAWLERVLVIPWARYDAVWFEHILIQGYLAEDGSTSFHPLYIWLSYPLYRLGVAASVSLLITSTLAALIFLLMFYKLARLDLEPATAWSALLLVATFPAAFILFAPYTESLFLVWATAALFSIRREWWGRAALFSFLAALSRQQGVFLVLPLAWGVWEASRKSWSAGKKAWWVWLAPLAAPAGLAAWGIYRIGFLHEGKLDFSTIQGLIYSALLSPSADKIIAGQAFRWPWEAFAIAISKAIHTPEMNVMVNLALGIGFLIAFLVAWKHMQITDRLYCLAIILVSFCVTTGQYAYASLPRHLFLATPVFIGLSAALQKWRYKHILLACQVLGLIFLLYLYVLNGWIP
jgi:hypothetical protein